MYTWGVKKVLWDWPQPDELNRKIVTIFAKLFESSKFILNYY